MHSSPPPSPPPSSSHTKPKNRVNVGTMLPPDLAGWRDRVARIALPVQKAYTMALANDWGRERQTEVGYRLVWLDDRVLGSIDAPDQLDRHVVIGRHASCDIVLDDELAVSLRHVLVRVSSLDDGFPVLKVLDLQTSAGFELSDGSRQRSVAATGPVVFRIGRHSLVALPSSGQRGDALPVPSVETSAVAPRRASPEPAPGAPPRKAPVSRITLLPKSVNLAERRSIVPAEPAKRVVPALLAPAERTPHLGTGYEVVLEGRGQRAGVRLTAEDLEHGVLIGQSDKCVDAGLRVVLSATISRVHVLLIREQDTVRLYDVASLNGTFVDHRRVRCLSLDDAGTTVNLAGHTGVTLSFRAM